MSKNAEDEFKAACSRHQCKRADPILCAQLRPHTVDTLMSCNLQATYVGNRQLMALLDVIEQANNFRAVDISGCNIYNTDLSADSVKGNALLDRLIEVARNHKGISKLVLNGNPLSNFAARKLLALANDNPRIISIELENTRVDKDLINLINKTCQSNAQKQEKAGVSVEPAFPPDPAFPSAPSGSEPFCAPSATDASTPETPTFGTAQLAPMSANQLAVGAAAPRRRTIMNPDSKQVAAEAAKFVPPKYDKSPTDEKLIGDLLRGNLLFSHLQSSSLEKCVGAMQKQEFKIGDEPLREGDEGNTLFVIAQGRVDIIKTIDGKKQKVAEKPEVGAQSSAFGELELMYDTPCVATVKVSTENLVTWALDRDTYKYIVVGSAIEKRRRYESLLSSVPFLAECSSYERSQIADALSSDEWDAGKQIITYGDEGEWMFLIVKGTVEIIGRDGAGGEKKVCEMTDGEYFGELEFLNNHACVADVRAVTKVETAKINRKHFEMCLGPVLDVLKRNADAPKYEHYRKLLESGQAPPSGLAGSPTTKSVS